MTIHRSVLVALAMLAGLWASQAQLSIQGEAASGFQFPVFATHPNQPRQIYLRALITGQSATVHADGTVSIEKMLIVSLTPERATNLIAHAAECLLNRKDNTATSTNQLHVNAGQGQLQITGRGFFCNLTNFNLFLSNEVQTTIQGGLLRSARDAKLLTPEAALDTGATLGTAAPPILIHSDRMTLQALSNVVTYEGAVQVESAQMDLACQTLVIQRATNGAIREIVADRDVVIRTKQGAGTAHGERGVYTTVSGGELFTLTGTPARWEDGPRTGRAGMFVLDLENNVLQAEHSASIELPRESLEQTDWVLSAPATPNPDSTHPTNQMVVIDAELLTLHFPTETRPGRSVLAQTNVLILNQSDSSRAGADRAFYAESTGTIELDGHASWSSQDRVIRADKLFLDRTNRSFRAAGEAYLRLPISALSRQVALPQLGQSPTEPGPDKPAALEVYSGRYQYREGVLTFEQEVRAHLLENNSVTTLLICQTLTVHGTNRLDQVYAQTDVHFEQLPVTLPNGRVIQRWLDCEWLALLVDTNGQPDRLLARTNVVAAKFEMRPGRPEPLTSRLRADAVTAEFMKGTNQFKQVLAEHNVMLAQGLRTAYGQQALYLGETDILTLTGQPTLDDPQGKITEASAFIFNLSDNTFQVQQARAEGDRLPAQTPFTRR